MSTPEDIPDEVDLVAVVVAGGWGSRFWPLSTPARPKQLVPLQDGRSMLRATLDRLEGLVPPERTLVLTGAAYRLADLPPARGRIFSDVDILVPRADIGRVEQALMMAGWHGSHHSAYDERYYRQWMHEIPPLRHIHRQALIDVHHNILPLTARFHPDAGALLAARVALPAGWGAVLAPVDMVLHSATHLFHEGEYQQGLRDLVDLRLLIGHFGAREGFWTELLQRARQLQLSRPLFYALRYTERLLGLAVPPGVADRIREEGPGPLRGRYMDWLFGRAFLSARALRPGPAESLARLLLYVRGHYLRMPPSLLLPHLARKAFAREED